MSDRFSKIYGKALWRSKRFTALSTSDAKVAFLYLLTCEHMTSAGCYSLPDGYAIADLGWDLDRYLSARGELVGAGLIAFDTDTSTIYVERWFKHSPAMNEKHAQGIMRLIGDLECEALQQRVLEEFQSVDALRKPAVAAHYLDETREQRDRRLLAAIPSRSRA